MIWRIAMSHATMFRGLLALTAALLVGIASQPVEARSVAAGVGVANSAQTPCIGFAYGTVTNMCSNINISLDIPMPVDTGGTKTVGVNAFGPSTTGNVGCIAEGMTEGGDTVFVSDSGYQWLPTFGASVTITMHGAYVPGGGQLVANCSIHPGGRVNTVNWLPV
jgi:hypothetical protein